MNFIDAPRLENPAPSTSAVPKDMVLDFGKRRGLAVSWIAHNDTMYALWLMGQGNLRRARPKLWLCLRKHVVRVLSDQEADHDAERFA